MQSAEIQAISQASAAPMATGGTMTRRALAALTAMASAALLIIAAVLTPSDAGLGTHRQLYGYSCSWISAADCPCPTCGMTTAFAHAADGNLLASFLAQPMGFLLALATAMTFLVAAFVALTGSRIAHRLTRLWHPRMTWVIAAIILGSWAFKIIWYKGWI